MKVEVYYRKGGGNAKFKHIVETVVKSLEQLTPKGRIQLRLLVKLKKSLGPMSGAWQNADELKNILGKNRHRFDIYNWENKTAIEVEESEVKYVWKDFVKLSIGARRGRVTYGILICPLNYGGKKMKAPKQIFREAITISKFMADILWMKNLAIIGYS